MANKIAPAKEESKEIALIPEGIVIKKITDFTYTTNTKDTVATLKKLAKKYVGIKMTDETMLQCEILKKQLVRTRRLLEAQKKESIDFFINPKKEAISLEYDTALKLVADMEGNLDVQIQEREAERKSELDGIFNGYIEKFLAEASLDVATHKGSIEIKKQYYNKGQKEADTRADIKEQIEEIKASIAEKEGNIALIKGECEGTDLSVDFWIKQLDYRPLTGILIDLKEEKRRKDVVPVAVGVDLPGDVFGSAPAEKKSTKKKVVMKEKTIKLTYPEEYGDKITRFFLDNPAINMVVLKS